MEVVGSWYGDVSTLVAWDFWRMLKGGLMGMPTLICVGTIWFPVSIYYHYLGLGSFNRIMHPAILPVSLKTGSMIKTEITEWPTQLPDLNPIENLWDKVGSTVEGLNPTNKQERTLDYTRNEISLGYLKKTSLIACQTDVKLSSSPKEYLLNIEHH